jgi:hypothetical protein
MIINFLPTMSFAHRRQKVLPDIRVDIDATRSATLAEERWLGQATPVNMNKALPPIKVENQVSKEEMRLLRELWNEAGLSAVCATYTPLTAIG